MTTKSLKHWRLEHWDVTENQLWVSLKYRHPQNPQAVLRIVMNRDDGRIVVNMYQTDMPGNPSFSFEALQEAVEYLQEWQQRA